MWELGITGNIIAAILYDAAKNTFRGFNSHFKKALNETSIYFSKEKGIEFRTEKLRKILEGDVKEAELNQLKSGACLIDRNKLALEFATYGEIYFPNEEETLPMALEILNYFLYRFEYHLLSDPTASPKVILNYVKAIQKSSQSMHESSQSMYADIINLLQKIWQLLLVSSKPQVFIVYAPDDHQIGERIIGALFAKDINAQLKPLILEQNDYFVETDINAILEANTFIFIWSQNSVNSNFVNRALKRVNVQEYMNVYYHIFFIKIDNTPLPQSENLKTIEMKVGFNEMEFSNLIKIVQEELNRTHSDIVQTQISRKQIGEPFDQSVGKYWKYKTAVEKLKELIFIATDKQKQILNTRQIYYNAAFKALRDAETQLFRRVDENLTQPFVNRKAILYKIREKNIRYVNIFGPSGYGKTYLLQALHNNWQLSDENKSRLISVYIDMSRPEINSIEKFCHELIRQIDPENSSPKYDLAEFASAIKKRFYNGRDYNRTLEEILILCDNLDVKIEIWIKWLLGKNGPVGSEFHQFFKDIDYPPRVRLIIASRSEIKIPSENDGVPLDKIMIDRLIMEDVYDLISKKIEQLHDRKFALNHDDHIVRCSKNIFKITAGHPRCIGEICDDYLPQFSLTTGWNEDRYFRKFIVPIILYEVVDQIELGNQYVLWCLSVFRYFDIYTLLELKTHQVIFVPDDAIEIVQSLITLITPLITSSLIKNLNKTRPVYSIEPALRSVLARWMKYENLDLFIKINGLACEMYDSILEGQRRAAVATKISKRQNYVNFYIYYFIEALFQHAQRAKLLNSSIETILMQKIDSYINYHKSKMMRDPADWVVIRQMLIDLWDTDQDFKDELLELTDDPQVWSRLSNHLRHLLGLI